MDEASTKACPYCGEEIKSIAIRCKHCQADLGLPSVKAEVAAAPAGELSPNEFEQKFLEFAYQTTARIDAPAVAYALKIPIAAAEERLEDLAASGVLVRAVDDEACVYYNLPGRVKATPGRALVRRDGSGALATQPGAPLAIQPPPSPQAMVGLLLNLVMPGLGSMVAGRTGEGVAQLMLFVIGIPLCFVLVGIPICLATWGWALSSGLRALNQSAATQDGPLV